VRSGNCGWRYAGQILPLLLAADFNILPNDHVEGSPFVKRQGRVIEASSGLCMVQAFKIIKWETTGCFRGIWFYNCTILIKKVVQQIMALSANDKPITTKRFLQDIIVSDDPGNQFPIYSFDLLVVVEPDQGTFIREDALDLAFDMEQIAIDYGEKMFDESMLTEESVPGHAQSIWPERTRILWLRNATENFFVQYGIDKAYVSFQYNQDHQASEDLAWYLQAAYTRYPQWRVAIVGGMLEDEISDVANFIRKIGFETTVLTRYCLSKKGALVQN